MSPTLNPIKRHREHCRDTRAQMSELLDDELDGRTAAKLERHARWCPDCRHMLANLRRTVAALHALESPPASDEPRTAP